MYNTTKAETFKFWRTVAQRYKNEPQVALYEIFNEPTINGTGPCTWTEWKTLQEQIIDTIRAYNPNAICLCAGFNWAYDLTPVADSSRLTCRARNNQLHIIAMELSGPSGQLLFLNRDSACYEPYVRPLFLL